MADMARTRMPYPSAQPVYADVDPGGRVELRVPLRAPRRPGTYRACLKMGWPNGVYCFPSTLVGVIVTVIVPAADLLAPRQTGRHDDRDSTRGTTPTAW
jgi:hypothetical protein